MNSTGFALLFYIAVLETLGWILLVITPQKNIDICIP